MLKEVISPCFRNACGLFHVNVNFDNEGKIVAIDTKYGKNGGCINMLWKTISTISTLCLEHGCPPEKIIKILTEKDKTDKYIFHCPENPSCIVGVGQQIDECQEEIKEGEK